MRWTMVRLALMAALMGSATAGETTIYRCADESGTGVVYSQSPCGDNAEPLELRDDTRGLEADPDQVQRSRDQTRTIISRQNRQIRHDRLVRASNERVRQLGQEREACDDLPLLRTRQGYWYRDFAAIEACRRRVDDLIARERAQLDADLAAARRRPD